VIQDTRYTRDIDAWQYNQERRYREAEAKGYGDTLGVFIKPEDKQLINELAKIHGHHEATGARSCSKSPAGLVRLETSVCIEDEFELLGK
jgi:hypothetical protein